MGKRTQTRYRGMLDKKSVMDRQMKVPSPRITKNNICRPNKQMLEECWMPLVQSGEGHVIV